MEASAHRDIDRTLFDPGSRYRCREPKMFQYPENLATGLMTLFVLLALYVTDFPIIPGNLCTRLMSDTHTFICFIGHGELCIKAGNIYLQFRRSRGRRAYEPDGISV